MNRDAKLEVAAHLEQEINNIMLHDFPFLRAEDALLMHRGDLCQITGIAASRYKQLAAGKRSTKTERQALKWAITARTLGL